jgi:hypothetical protein
MEKSESNSKSLTANFQEMRGEVLFRAVFAVVEPHAVVPGKMPRATQ